MEKCGLFVTFEGADGCGKTTQMSILADYLKNKGVDLITTRDPGGTPLGLTLRDILLNYQGSIAPMCELFLYLADRAQHVDEKIVPALNEGKMVICDRYIDSTIAYQGYARGLNIDEIIDLNNIVTHSLMPDLTILFDVNTEVAMTRVGSTKDRMESEASHFHQKVREGYLEIAKNNPQRIKIIDANRSIEEVTADVIKIFESIE